MELPEHMYVVIFENDKPQYPGTKFEFFDDSGPIIMETYLSNTSLDRAHEIAHRFQKYGKAVLCKLEVIGEIDQVRLPSRRVDPAAQTQTPDGTEADPAKVAGPQSIRMPGGAE